MSTESSAAEKIDVGAQQIAAVYAKAFLAAVQSSGHAEKLLTELDQVVQGLFGDSAELSNLLGSDRVKHEDKVRVIDRIVGGKVSPQVVNFLKVLSRHGRLGAIRQIRREVRALFEQSAGLVRVHVKTAAPLDAAVRSNLEQRLAAMLESKPELETTVDPELIGGVVVRVGDTVYDGSIARQLDKTREQMIHRSVHEIQSRRDRFRPSAGN